MQLKTKFMTIGSNIYAFRLNGDVTSDSLSPKIYTLQHSQIDGFYLTITKEKLEIPSKIYGKTLDRVQKCLSTYQNRTTSTGILLTGDKGTGKTLLMSLLANQVIDVLRLPVILIKDAHAGSQFVSFIESLGECCVVIDEFGKLYSATDRKEHDVPQKTLLSLMDGVDKTKRMFIMTENDESDINDFMLNRPSRIYYHFRYKKLDEESIIGYCQDHNVVQSVSKDLIDLSRKSKIFSFDMLQSIIEEHLRFGSSIAETVSDLNIDTRSNSANMIQVIKIIENGSNKEHEIFDTPFVPKPSNNGYTYIKVKKLNRNEVASEKNHPSDEPVAVDASENYEEIYVRDTDLAYESDGKLVYETEQYTFVTKSISSPQRNFYSML